MVILQGSIYELFSKKSLLLYWLKKEMHVEASILFSNRHYQLNYSNKQSQAIK